MTSRTTVVVKAFDPISQAGIASQLRFQPTVQVVEEEPAVVAVVVVDRVDEQALQAIRAAQRHGGRVVVVATQVDTKDVLAAVEAGCAGLLRRVEALPDRLSTAIRAAAAGEGVLAPDLLGRLLEQVGRLQREVLDAHGLTSSGLTKREIGVLTMVAEGLATDEIARRMSYSERTVKNVIHDVTTRLQLRNRAHAVAFAVREGLI